jgi:hypothetical protein
MPERRKIERFVRVPYLGGCSEKFRLRKPRLIGEAISYMFPRRNQTII